MRDKNAAVWESIHCRKQRRSIVMKNSAQSAPVAALPPAAPELPAAQWALFLDVDGTLLELAATPEAVQIPAGLPALLQQLHRHLHGALALISGRAIVTLDQLFTPLQLPAAGLHGFERRDAAGTVQRADIDTAAVAQLRSAVQALAATLPGVLLEDKGCTFALHYRQAPDYRQRLGAAVAALAHGAGFDLLAGHCVYELKPPGVHKGSALDAFLAEAPFAGRRPVFLGDDSTDEFALAAARGAGGIAIQVGGRRSEAAQFALTDPAAVRAWLQRWEQRWP